MIRSTLLMALLLPTLALAGNTVHSERYRGATRTYAVIVPDGCVPDGVVFVLHGKGGSHLFLRRSGIDKQAQSHCKIAVAPDSLGVSWDKDLASADVGFLRKLIARYPGPLAFIGHSAGATMSQVMHWCLGYGDAVVLSANTSTDAVVEQCSPFDGGNALLIMGRDDYFWDDPARPSFLDFVGIVADDSDCGRMWQSREVGDDGVTIYRDYSRCNVRVVVPMELAHDWWEPEAEYAFEWLYGDGDD